MGHHITGVLGKVAALKSVGGRFTGQPCFALAEGFAFMPLDHENLDDIIGLHDENAIHDFVYLTPHLAEALRAASAGCDVAYIETEYHGGNGGQGALMLSNGESVYGPTWIEEDTGPINEVLKRLGISTKPGKHDAFDAVGLDDWRSNENFRERGRAI